MRKIISVPALKMIQPMGEFFIAVISHEDLVKISYSDMRDIESDLDEYIGIQRKLRADRVKQIEKFVNTIDATFPTSVVLAVPGDCAEFDAENGILSLRETDEVPFSEIAKILDGQHRIEGLKGFVGEEFEVAITVFVEADIADQAYIFATVNLAQTKVNKSLVYDLLDYSKSRSPQKSCHDIAVALDRLQDSPFHKRIKRLGSATPGRVGETLTQATFVNSLLPFVTDDPVGDRDLLLRGKRLKKALPKDLAKYPFRNLFIDERDHDIAKILLAYFSIVKEKWPRAWQSREAGNMLPRTNGFRALMRFLKNAYLSVVKEESIGRVASEDEFRDVFGRIDIDDDDLTTDTYGAGTSGETDFYKDLRRKAGV